MKKNSIFLSIAFCAIMGLVACDPVAGAGGNTPNEPNTQYQEMINLAALGNELRNSNLDDIKKTIQKKGFTPFNEKHDVKDFYTKSTIYYSNGIQLDNSMSEDNIKSLIRQQKQNATILWIEYYWLDNVFHLEDMECVYILAQNAVTVYQNISMSLDLFYSSNYPFIQMEGTNNPTALSQSYNWNAEIGDRSYTNMDSQLAFHASNNAITEAEYQDAIMQLGGDKRNNREAFNNRLTTAHRDISESFRGFSIVDGINHSYVELETSDNDSYGNILVVKGEWEDDWLD